MKTINLDRYMPELSATYSFYRYREAVFRNKELREQIAEQEFRILFATAMPFLKVDQQNPQQVEELFWNFRGRLRN
jgi:hypothetical protein